MVKPSFFYHFNAIKFRILPTNVDKGTFSEIKQNNRARINLCQHFCSKFSPI